MLRSDHDNQLIARHVDDLQGGIFDHALNQPKRCQAIAHGLCDLCGVADGQTEVDPRIFPAERHQMTREPVACDRLAGMDRERSALQAAQF